MFEEFSLWRSIYFWLSESN